MDRKHQPSMGEPGVFTLAEHDADPRAVTAYAAATGRAVVVGADGQPQFYISILTQDLPTLD